MKEFIDKLISRLEEESDYEPIDYDYCDMSCSGEEHFIATHKAISIVNQLAEEYKLFGKTEQVNGGWIPCERELPKEYVYVYATCVSLIDDREPWVIEGYYSGLIGFDAMSSMLRYGEAKVVAWMPHKLPAPFKEGE